MLHVCHWLNLRAEPQLQRKHSTWIFLCAGDGSPKPFIVQRSTVNVCACACVCVCVCVCMHMSGGVCLSLSVVSSQQRSEIMAQCYSSVTSQGFIKQTANVTPQRGEGWLTQRSGLSTTGLPFFLLSVSSHRSLIGSVL